MTADKVAIPTPAPAPQQSFMEDLKVCEEIRKRLSLVPPAVVDALCDGTPTPWVCLKATYVKELLEVARMLGRSHLLRLETDC